MVRKVRAVAWWHVVWAVASAAAVAAAGPQSASQPADASQPARASQPVAPDWIEITADDVQLRSRPDRNSTAVARLGRGAVLRVVGERFGWYEVEPPPETFCLVSARHVEIAPDGRGLVRVESGSLRVRVGSSVRPTDPARSEVQALLPSGAVVRVRGRESDEWLRIDPPPGVRFYVHSDYAAPIDEADARRRVARREAESALRGATTQPGGEVAGVAGAAAGPASAPAPPRPIDLSGPWGRRLAAIETRIQAERDRSPAEQRWEALIDELRPIAAQADEPPIARLAGAWIAELGARAADRDVLRRAREIARREERGREQLERELAAIERARSRGASSGDAFDARGEVTPSFAFDRARHPRRYRLVNPLTRQTECYIEFPPEIADDPAAWTGKYVGVRGARDPSAEGGVDVLVVREIVELAAPASQPTRGPP